MRTIPLLVTSPFIAVLAIGCGANDHTLGFLPGSADGGMGNLGSVADAGATGVTDATFAADVPSLIGDGAPVVSEASLITAFFQDPIEYGACESSQSSALIGGTARCQISCPASSRS
jgi:hypothetical protein